MKYSPGKDEVHHNVIHTENELEVQVKDFGIGMTATESGKAFNRFYRMEGLGKHISGLGVGLYITRQLFKSIIRRFG